MSNFTTIDLSSLDAVTGGANEAPNQTKGSFNVGYDDGKRKIGVQGDGLKAATDYKACVDTVAGMKNTTPADIRAACGLPPGAKE